MDDSALLQPSADVAIIGAGPQAMSLVIQLLENDCESRFSDSERSRLRFWTQKNSSVAATPTPSAVAKPRIVVLDPSNSWMKRWEQNFNTLAIPHLRSPVRFHPGALSESLIEFATQQGRQDELCDHSEFDDLRKTFRKKRKTGNISLFNEVDRKYFSFPSRELFEDYCRDVVKKYKLNDYLLPCKVLSIDVNSDDTLNLHVTGTGGEGILHCHRVVYAANIGIPRLPTFISSRFGAAEATVFRAEQKFGNFTCLPAGFSWALDESQELKSLLENSAPSSLRIAVVGAGMTAAHKIIKLKGIPSVAKIMMLTRKQIAIHQFDSDAPWSSRLQNLYRHDYFKRDFPGRAELYRQVRRPGSMTSKMCAQLLPLEEAGALSTVQTVVQSYEYSSETSDGVARRKIVLNLLGDQKEEFDAVILATGADYNVNADPLLSSLIEHYNVPIHSGLPEIQPTLKLAHEANVYVMGVYAALQVGPDALNISGGRRSSSIIADHIHETLTISEGQLADCVEEYCTGNPFSVLDC